MTQKVTKPAHNPLQLGSRALKLKESRRVQCAFETADNTNRLLKVGRGYDDGPAANFIYFPIWMS